MLAWVVHGLERGKCGVCCASFLVADFAVEFFCECVAHERHEDTGSFVEVIKDIEGKHKDEVKKLIYLNISDPKTDAKITTSQKV